MTPRGGHLRVPNRSAALHLSIILLVVPFDWPSLGSAISRAAPDADVQRGSNLRLFRTLDPLRGGLARLRGGWVAGHGGREGTPGQESVTSELSGFVSTIFMSDEDGDGDDAMCENTHPVANLKSISHRCHPILVAFVWELTKATINLPLGCLQGCSASLGLTV